MIKQVKPGIIQGSLLPPADKSISHRALLFSALAQGQSRISNLLPADDVRSTWRCLEALGVRIERRGAAVLVHGRGGRFAAPRLPLYFGNSGTSLRLLSGLLAAQPLQAVLTGDSSLNRRPMQRVLAPLRLMGAQAYATPNGTAPLLLLGQPLHGISYRLPVASAQLKSALLLAAIQAQGQSEIIEPIPSRDHTERMLADMGVVLRRQGDSILVDGAQQLQARERQIPGDFSSAAPFIVAAALTEGSRLQVRNVGLNPTRTGLLSVLRRMGAEIRVVEKSQGDEEPFGEVLVKGSGELSGTEVTAAEIPLLIDEAPLLVLAGCLARGSTRIQGVAELRVKESDRVESMVQPLRRMGADILVVGDSLLISGQRRLSGGMTVTAAADHRIAMALAVAAVVAERPIQIAGAEWVGISYPDFFTELARLQEGKTCVF